MLWAAACAGVADLALARIHSQTQTQTPTRIPDRTPGLDPDDYIFPLQQTSRLYSANFGELRPGHFHAGVDIKTDGVEGKEVVAVADGYLSRMVVSAGGYGRALYLTLNNGTTAVYGHLQRFRPDRRIRQRVTVEVDYLGKMTVNHVQRKAVGAVHYIARPVMIKTTGSIRNRRPQKPVDKILQMTVVHTDITVQRRTVRQKKQMCRQRVRPE